MNRSGNLLWFLGGMVLFVCTMWLGARWSAMPEGARTPSGLFDNIPGVSDWFGGDKEDPGTFETAAEAIKLNEQQKRGREIWFKATGENDRFHTYLIPQRVGDRIMDFGRMFAGKSRDTRFDDWGLINDPECCRPGAKGCPVTDPKETYGFDYCKGDDALLKAVGNPNVKYHDPACDLDKKGEQGAQSACDLKFGTSAGAVGFRKFPNPRFDKEKWVKLTGGLDSWKNYSDNRDVSVTNRLSDGSVEPPFRVGIACASCHASFDPTNPPADVNNPHWNNIGGLVGAQYMYSSQVFGAGFAKHSLEWQILTNARPGTVDTSAVPNDQVNNPGTMNAIINFDKRPTFKEDVDTWRQVKSCTPGPNCDCPPGKPCYEKSLVQGEPILHILKGGEDSIGPKHAILRVHVNIGVCAEQCWLNHLTDIRVLDPSQRNYGQTPFDIGQCRRDCPAYRALEDRIDDELAFVLSGRPYDLYKAKKLNSPAELEAQINKEYGMPNAVEHGRKLYVQHCASCHSSQANPTDKTDFLAVDANGVRIDWLGSDKRIPASEVGTYDCRSLHSNHMTGHVWQDYASEDYKNLSPVKNVSGEATGGRGHYRAISLLSVWAFAPFMHNNAVGPEICAKHPTTQDFTLNVNGSYDCQHFDPTVEGRLKVYRESMDALLNPEKRGKKVTYTTSEIEIPVSIDMPHRPRYRLVIPKGVRVSRIGSFRHKDMVKDMRSYLVNESDPTVDTRVKAVFKSFFNAFKNSKDGRLVLDEPTLVKLGEVYTNCAELYEDKGHTFGSGLSKEEKLALTAFMETL